MAGVCIPFASTLGSHQENFFGGAAVPSFFFRRRAGAALRVCTSPRHRRAGWRVTLIDQITDGLADEGGLEWRTFQSMLG